ncbi:M23 family peptidase, partial [Xanthomonas sp. Kuri4-1]
MDRWTRQLRGFAHARPLTALGVVLAAGLLTGVGAS